MEYPVDFINKLVQSDCLEAMKQISDNIIDLLVTDPPYGISFMSKEWDQFNEVVNPQGAYEKVKGFKKLPRQNTKSMTDFFIPVWKEVLRILKPGAFAFVMCSPRADVMAKQISCLAEAGFNVGFTPMFWTFAQGFPKAINIGKVIDKKTGNQRKIIGHYVAPDGVWRDCDNHKPNEEIRNPETQYGYKTSGFRPIDKGDHPLEGSYGGFQPKPAVEVIIVAMKPLEEKTYVNQALKNQKGITWLDDCRVPYKSATDKESARYGTQADIRGGNLKSPIGIKDKNVLSSEQGRFPANLLVSDDILNDGAKHKVGQPVGGFGAMGIGIGKPLQHQPYAYRGKKYKVRGFIKNCRPQAPSNYADSGSYSRYFDLDAWFTERMKSLPENMAKTFPFLIVPKASKSEKNDGLEQCEDKIMARSGGAQQAIKKGEAEYLQNHIGLNRISVVKNNHPTVKPIKLFSFLITLGSREKDVVLDPFIGSGTTALAAVALNRNFIGIESDKEYVRIAQARLDYVMKQRRLF